MLSGGVPLGADQLVRFAENEPHGPFADILEKLVRSVALGAPSYSRVGTLGKYGAVQAGRPLPALTVNQKPDHTGTS